ncbi:MAG TPA: murein L,D-transpeptidase catalytic domain family protein [Thermoanaerobaculia bacterium]|nr:murein L,D-transpeptidase catalytic domain family protein [Thermoanaerobaculia bacterium]
MKRFVLASAIAFSLVPATDALAEKAARSSRSSDALAASLLRQAPGLRGEVLRLALDAADAAGERGLVRRRDIITVIDYSLPSTQPRLFVFDLAARKLLFRELCAHGKNSGGNRTNFFSNSPGSLATSLGLFVTEDTYMGGNGYSLRLRGLEEGVNDMALDRAIVMHGASYVSRAAIQALGRLGRSWGCPAVRKEVAKKIINTVRGGSAVFAYYPEKRWLQTSEFFRRKPKAVVATND